MKETQKKDIFCSNLLNPTQLRPSLGAAVDANGQIVPQLGVTTQVSQTNCHRQTDKHTTQVSQTSCHRQTDKHTTQASQTNSQNQDNLEQIQHGYNNPVLPFFLDN